MTYQKSSDYKETAVQYYLVEDKSQEDVCKVFKCTRRSLMRWVQKYKNEGWNVLNKAKAGGLGGCAKVWKKEEIEKIAKDFTSPSKADVSILISTFVL